MNQEKLCQLEQIIDKGRTSFHEIGSALKKIRDEKLYKIALYETFEAYIRERWDMGRSQAYRLIEASTVMDNLSPIGDILPENEFQARALAGLSKIRQREIWREFLRSGSELTAGNIRKFIARNGKKRVPEKNNDLANLISEDYKSTVFAMLEQIREAKSDNWQKTSRQAALLWNRAMKEKIISRK